MKMLLITTAGEVELVDRDGDLASFQRLVGGDIEAFPWREDVAFYFNEEGKLLGLPRNELATGLLDGMMLPGDYIVGDTVLVGMDEATGESIDLTEGQQREIMDELKALA
jgi:hypothetical protein